VKIFYQPIVEGSVNAEVILVIAAGVASNPLTMTIA
jgi:molybdopterin-binding protein